MDALEKEEALIQQQIQQQWAAEDKHARLENFCMRESNVRCSKPIKREFARSPLTRLKYASTVAQIVNTARAAGTIGANPASTFDLCVAADVEELSTYAGDEHLHWFVGALEIIANGWYEE